MKAQLTFIHALSPLHAGIGHGAGVIDLPIAREKATGIPFLPGSSTKGALRTRCAQDKQLEQYQGIFGSEPSEVQEMRTGSVQFTDQRLLLLPVRSIAGTFAWVTSPYVLRRFLRDLIETQGKEAALSLPIPHIEEKNQCIVTHESKLKQLQKKNQQEVQMVYLEDFDLTVDTTAAEQIDTWATMLGQAIFPDEDAWKVMFSERICLVHDDLFHFMCQHATEIMTRIRLQDDTKTVTDGGLWYEEALPAETILSGIAVINPVPPIPFSETQISKALNDITERTLQFGGKATVGRGLCRVHLV
ncbi:MAG: type III-B CRISPR module RAMP protein Cmr4 [Ktedonobacteraceae bacterium]|nr:type III-B CRISPR module RAMP protein Cmr4 [Ktedonobacteraceae bacterium]